MPRVQAPSPRSTIRRGALLAAATASLLAASAAPAAGIVPARRLADEFARAATALVQTPAPTVAALEATALLLREAATLAGDDPELWRMFLEAADLVERRDLRREALRMLVRLDPGDDAARLRFVNEAVERYQTVDQRVEFYRKLLADERREQLGPAVASRLALDLALLLRRAGDEKGFAEWLAESVTIDPSNRGAAATAAGFFRLNVDDPVAEAELLAVLVTADPAAAEPQTALAQLLMDHGAYGGAARLYRLAVDFREAAGGHAAGGLLADLALAMWAEGDASGALELVRRRQSAIDEVYRRELRRQSPELEPLELARRHAPITATLATVRAAIHNRRGDDLAEPTLASTLAAYRAEIEALRAAEDVDADRLARAGLEAAFVTLWLGGDVEEAAGFIDLAAGHLGEQGLRPVARARFDGWLALRGGDAARAIALLRPLADDDRPARLGYALALRQQGRPRDAARELHGIFRRDPGTLIGVWSADLLEQMLGQRPAPGEPAPRMEAIASSIPSVIDRFPHDPTLAVSMRLLPRKLTFEPYEPVVVEIEITNNAPVPLAIDPEGPIQPQVAVMIDLQLPVPLAADRLRSSIPDDLPPLIVDIQRRLRLEPHEPLVVPVDLRRSALGPLLNRMPLLGATFKMTAVSNFWMSASQVIGPGPLGSESSSPPIRVDGVRLTPQWIENAMAAVVEPDGPDDLEAMALLTHVVRMFSTAEQRPQLTEDAARAVVEAYSKLDPGSRAWMLGLMNRSPALDPIYEMAQGNDHGLVRLAYLMFCLTGPGDPVLDAAAGSDDQVVRAIAQAMEERVAPANRSP